MALTIGGVAKATGVAPKTIRYYEQVGVLPGALRPRLLHLVRGHLSTVRQQLGELRLLERQLEQVLRRRVGPPQERAGGCRGLDSAAPRPTRQSARVLRSVDGLR